MPKYYFETEESEKAYTLDYFLARLQRPFTLFESIPAKVEGFFYCKWSEEVGKEGYCGRMCEGYDPRNGKSGICKHKGGLYEPGKAVLFN